MVRTVINNLLRNAIHHTSEGDITLVAHRHGFTICDTGPGISKSERDAIFKPFYRGKKGSQQGLGLGLSLVKRICEKEQWAVSVSDNHPSGCCFEVAFKN
jgi:signal transduction histidine kinase